MSSAVEIEPGARLADALRQTFQDAEQPIVAVVHELLTWAARGYVVCVRYVVDADAIELSLTQPGSAESCRLDLPRAGVQIRSICARLAKLCRRADGTHADVYDDRGIIPVAVVENLATLRESDPMAGRGLVAGDRMLNVEYHNDKRRPVELRIGPPTIQE